MRDATARRWGARALDRLIPGRRKAANLAQPKLSRRMRKRLNAAPPVYMDRRARRALARSFQTKMRKATRGQRMTCAGPSEKAVARAAARA